PALEKLAAANKLGKGKKDWEFNEWLTAAGVPMGSAYQSWSAAMFILAHEYVKGKANLWWLAPSA
ncbi:MAG: glycogen debranching protein, partial [Candidatus Aenigmarchaeota archaeon]|nr:glycogen debranching protein [Candidatus Aenigmarchaeota archaeon]